MTQKACLTFIQYFHSNIIPKLAISQLIFPHIIPHIRLLLSSRYFLPVNIASDLHARRSPVNVPRLVAIINQRCGVLNGVGPLPIH